MEHELRPAIYAEKQFGWAHKLGEMESQGISRVGHTVLVRLTESQIWYQLAGSMG